MDKPQKHPQETERLEALKRLAILDTEREERFDIITKSAADKLSCPISTVSIIDEKREWFKSCVGLDETEGPRESSFCGHSLLAKEMFIIEDTLLDDRFKDNPHVTGAPYIRFYAGVALNDHVTNLPIGVFCVKDTKPRKLSVAEIADLIDLAEKAEEEMNRKA